MHGFLTPFECNYSPISPHACPVQKQSFASSRQYIWKSKSDDAMLCSFLKPAKKSWQMYLKHYASLVPSTELESIDSAKVLRICPIYQLALVVVLSLYHRRHYLKISAHSSSSTCNVGRSGRAGILGINPCYFYHLSSLLPFTAIFFSAYPAYISCNCLARSI